MAISLIKFLPRKIIFLQVILIVILGAGIYINCASGGFVWDDHGLIKDNAYIKGQSNFLKVFTADFGAGSTTGSSFYRPLQVFIHMAGYSLWGSRTLGYHLTSILMHILAAIILLFFLRNILQNKTVSFLASLLFLSCPVNTEAVCYISGLSDPLALVFILACLVFYLKSLRSNNRIFFIFSLLSFVLALLSKENAVVLPLLILLYHYAFGKKLKIRMFLPFCAILTGYILFRIFILNLPGFLILTPVDFWARVPAFFAAVANYFRLLLMPFGLHIEYGNRLFKFTDFQALSGFALTLFLLTIGLIKRKSNPELSFAIGWFFIALLPVSNIYPVSYSFMMEHYLYLPALGFFIILANLLCSPSKYRLVTFFLRFCIIGVIIFYAYLTIKQSGYWKEPIAFYKRTLQYAPDSWRFYNELGIEYAARGASLEAEAAYKEALRINPDMAGVHYNLVNLYIKSGNQEKLSATYKTINAINLKLSAGYYAAGIKFNDEGSYARAIDSFRKALELDPNNLTIINELANSYVLMGEYGKAVFLFKKVLEVKPDSALAYNNLAVAYYYLKQYTQAVKNCDKAIELGYPVEPILINSLKPYKK